MKGFSESESKLLIEKAKKAKEENVPLVAVFLEFASETGRAFGSVRNYYYKTVKRLSKKDELYQKLGLSDKLKPMLSIEFTRIEERALLYSVFKGITQGKSVRKVINELSGGREKLALRYQNKYRNLIKRNTALVDEIIELVRKELGDCAVYKIKKQEKCKDYERLERQINVMLDNIIRKIKQENETIKKRAKYLEEENHKLKIQLSKTTV